MNVYVYIAMPYTGDEEKNVKAAMDVWTELCDIKIPGIVVIPICPHWSHFQDARERHKRSYEEWLAWCLAMVRKCDYILRMPGVSPGADREVELARALHIPVLTSVGELRDALDAWTEE